MNEEPPRRPPLVIHVPPPEAGWNPATRWLITGLLLAVDILVVALFFLLSGAPIQTRAVLVGAAAATTGIVILVFRLQHARERAQREAFLTRFPDWEQDPVAVAVAKKWRPGRQPPTADVVLQAIGDTPVPNLPRSRVVCLGPVDVPEVGDFRFEPVIITPTRFLWKRLWIVPLGLALGALWLAQLLDLLPGSLPIGRFGYLLWIAGAAGVAWVWRTTVRPTYLRLAPGMVQVVAFGLGKKKPTIRSYPMRPGTVAIVRQAGAARVPHSLTLAYGDQQDAIPLWQMQRRQDATERLWQALLSTAPTPPLSDEGLVG